MLSVPAPHRWARRIPVSRAIDRRGPGFKSGDRRNHPSHRLGRRRNPCLRNPISRQDPTKLSGMPDSNMKRPVSQRRRSTAATRCPSSICELFDPELFDPNTLHLRHALPRVRAGRVFFHSLRRRARPSGRLARGISRGRAVALTKTQTGFGAANVCAWGGRSGGGYGRGGD